MSADDIKRMVDNAAVDAPDDDSAIIYRRASEIQIKPINWLWKGRIARGKVSMIAGDPGLGKSQITISMASIVTNGGIWPVDKAKCDRGNVIFLSAEDDAADTIVPRLKAAKAVTDSVYIIDAVLDRTDSDGNKIPKHFNLATNLDRLDKMLSNLGNVALIIIDPITAYLGKTDSHKTSDVRALLAPLSKLAEKHNVAIVCISHLNKADSNDAITRVTGSLAFVAAARAAFLVTKDKDDANKRLFLPIKNNIGNDQTGLAFTLENSIIDCNIETSRISWCSDPVSITANEALSQNDEPNEESALNEAKEFLCDLLVSGSVPAKKVRRSSEDAGHSWATTRRAKDKLDIKSKKSGDEWMWGLPIKAFPLEENAQDAQDARTKSLGTLNTLTDSEHQSSDFEIF
jgi:putative DNA primase/helicase